jgi:hypothetical protein
MSFISFSVAVDNVMSKEPGPAQATQNVSRAALGDDQTLAHAKHRPIKRRAASHGSPSALKSSSQPYRSARNSRQRPLTAQ